MKIFFDTEFTGLHKNTSLISIGLVSEDEKEFYAEIADFDTEQLNDWLIDNVISNTKWLKNGVDNNFLMFNNNCHGNTRMCANKEKTGKCLLEWLSQFNEIQFVADVTHYDFVLLIDLLADSALDLPRNISACCEDINESIAKLYGISSKEAFDKSREEIVKIFDRKVSGDKHNALYDAKVCKEIYEIFKENFGS